MNYAAILKAMLEYGTSDRTPEIQAKIEMLTKKVGAQQEQNTIVHRALYEDKTRGDRSSEDVRVNRILSTLRISRLPREKWGVCQSNLNTFYNVQPGKKLHARTDKWKTNLIANVWACLELVNPELIDKLIPRFVEDLAHQLPVDWDTREQEPNKLGRRPLEEFVNTIFM